MSVKYEVLVGVSYTPDGGDTETDHPVGDVVDDVPAEVLDTWLAEGVLQPFKEKVPATRRQDNMKGGKH